MLERDVRLRFQEDNQSCCRIIASGLNPTMRHIARTHRIDIAWLHEVYLSKQILMSYCPSDRQAADIFTKAFTDRLKFQEVARLICHMSDRDFWHPSKKGEGKVVPKGVLDIILMNPPGIGFEYDWRLPKSKVQLRPT